MTRLPYQNAVAVAGHRGNAKFFPENTMAGFRSAVSLKPDMIEMDVHMTKDRRLVVMHDHNVKRTTNGEGLIRDMTSTRSAPSTPEAGRDRSSPGSGCRPLRSSSHSWRSTRISC